MTFYTVFPGILLAYISINASTWPAPDLSPDNSDEASPLLFNYCMSGRCELHLDNGSFVYVKEGNISLTERFAKEDYVYPRRIYEGIELFIDGNIVHKEAPYIADNFAIDSSKLAAMYCPDGKTYISAGDTRCEKVLKELWMLYEETGPSVLFQMKLCVLKLLGLLLETDGFPPSRACAFFTAAQVEIAKKVERLITADLRKHHPAREMAESFAVSETSLKNYFKGVYGQNISAYLRELRMKKAAQQLSGTGLAVSEIAESVGYLNQSKFAAVFKQQFEMAPLEYRRRANIDKTEL
ncbi:MAG: helix-turn-helix domain-containing protein [Lachnospiraceae bacterium]